MIKNPPGMAKPKVVEKEQKQEGEKLDPLLPEPPKLSVKTQPKKD